LLHRSGVRVGGHDFERVDVEDDGYVLVCECGWRSRPDPSAGVIGEEWDEHRAASAMLPG
jgi:hypothetical protein